MTGFTPKTYQSQVLDSIEAYFRSCHEFPSASIAFHATTERLWGRGLTYHPLSGFPTDMPYFCLRVPTGGGKTWLAAKSVQRVNTHLLRGEHSVILWLTPSKPIREQTLKALKDRQHPYHTAAREAGPITIMDLEEAKSVTRATLDTSTTIIALPEKPDLKHAPQSVRDKVRWNSPLNTLTIRAPLTEDETTVLQASVRTETAAAAIVEVAKTSRATASEFFQTPAERGERFRIPQLALRVQGEPQLFDDPEVLEYPWNLSPHDAAPTADDLARLGAGFAVSEGGEINVDDASGKLISRFLPKLQRDLGLVYQPENWNMVRLAAWLCRNLPEPSLTHVNKQTFVAAWLSALLKQNGFTLARASLQKFLIRNLIEARIRALRQQAVAQAFQQTLFGDNAAARVTVSDLYAFEFHPQAYAPSRDYDSRFGRFDFRGHYYGRIGDFDSREEFECACWLDTQAQKGRLQFWVRNLVRREGFAFFLQKADGRFYPDFLCQLPSAEDRAGIILAVEYKGADRWTAAEDDRLIGGLWAELSGGRYRFVMLKDQCWDWIEERLR